MASKLLKRLAPCLIFAWIGLVHAGVNERIFLVNPPPSPEDKLAVEFSGSIKVVQGLERQRRALELLGSAHIMSLDARQRKEWSSESGPEVYTYFVKGGLLADPSSDFTADLKITGDFLPSLKKLTLFHRTLAHPSMPAVAAAFLVESSFELLNVEAICLTAF